MRRPGDQRASWETPCPPSTSLGIGPGYAPTGAPGSEEKAGVSTKTIAQLGYGRQRAHDTSMRAIAGALGVEVGAVEEFAGVLAQRRVERRGQTTEGDAAPVV